MIIMMIIIMIMIIIFIMIIFKEFQICSLLSFVFGITKVSFQDEQ